ncbi:unnamed protein product [Gongylonema pulchrum]|uniref:Uncharacterized protein n=1 Tax=Gongylonema pulchrum TaxID=637853 RepID=A0A183DQ53_9BILA|nr:unnamed protein product [Gongylonema pulchrum]
MSRMGWRRRILFSPVLLTGASSLNGALQSPHACVYLTGSYTKPPVGGFIIDPKSYRNDDDDDDDGGGNDDDDSDDNDDGSSGGNNGNRQTVGIIILSSAAVAYLLILSLTTIFH